MIRMFSQYILFIIFFSLFFIFPGNISAVAQSSFVPKPTKQVIEYSFVYPGILPDNPLYVLKVARDRIVDFFTKDPQKHIEFLLLMADKRLIMGQYLVEKDNVSLAHSTILKGEKYFLRATEETAVHRKSNREVAQRLREELRIAHRKHREVLVDIESKLSPDEKRQWRDIHETLDIIEKNLQ